MKTSNEKTKTCSKCKEAKSVEEFYKGRTRSGGLQSCCKTCARAKSKRWREANPEASKEYNRRRREANPEAIKEYHRRWYASPEGRARTLLLDARRREAARHVPEPMRIDIDLWLPAVIHELKHGEWWREFAEILAKKTSKTGKGRGPRLYAPTMSRIRHDSPLYTDNFRIEPWVANAGRGQGVRFPKEARRLWGDMFLARISDTPLKPVRP